MRPINLRRVIAVSLVVFSLLLSVSYYLNPGQLFKLNLDQHNIISTEAEVTYHTVAYGVSGEKTEQAYLLVQKAFGAEYVRNKVHIYVARPKYPAGQIGEDTINNIRYYGVFKRNFPFGKDVIIYDGNDFVLLHELAHFFYSHMKQHHRDEIFATMFQDLAQMQVTFKTLVQILHLVSDLNAKKNSVLTPDLSN